ncbi:unnamed protein product [Meloidogyne enterolobii]|uniref:Uncharacterized protein n=1 Tax=Meloidogyne enterolobii TaxID=390850 RepID=A0ACB1ABH6_MELEN
MILNLCLVFFTACLYTSVEGLGLHQAKMTDDLRKAILRAHNNYRSQLAKGLVTDGSNKTMPAGKNIYKFVYKLSIEKIAQATADNCKMAHPGTVGYGENLWANSWAMDNLTEAVNGAPLSWWSEKDKCPILANNLQVTPDVFDKCGHMTPMAWSHTTQIGCGIQLCPAQDWCSGWNPPCYNTTLISCNYFNPTNDAGNILMYEKGNPCSKDSDCDYYANSKCDTSCGLCKAPLDATDPHKNSGN